MSLVGDRVREEHEMKIKLLPGYPTYEFKNNDRNKYLLTVFIVCCLLIVWMTGELIFHAR